MAHAMWRGAVDGRTRDARQRYTRTSLLSSLDVYGLVR